MSDTPLQQPVVEAAESTDVPMEDMSAQPAPAGPVLVKGEEGGDSEAAALLLGIASAIEERPVISEGVPPKDIVEAVEAEEAAQPPLPYTPPDDRTLAESSTLPPLSFSHQMTVATDPPAIALQTSLPTSDSPGPSTKPKAKRKRQSAAGPSRRRSNDPSLPHFLGEDNQQIRCICGFNDDDGFTIQCERCYAWQHGQCFGFFHEEAAPDTYFCELCEPRQVDREAARQRQIQRQIDRQAELQDILRISRGATARKPLGSKPERGPDPDRAKHRKPKRTRTESVLEGEEDTREAVKDSSPGAMGPPTTKPKRKTGPKPRSSKSSIIGQALGPSIREASVVPAQALLTEEDELFFLVNPWEMEFTPIRENIVRGKVARQRMAALYREWVDVLEEDEVTSPRRTINNPSGLPSPTETGVLRLSPDSLFPQPDFAVLAPPVPPVFLSSYDGEIEVAETSVRTVEGSTSFLPLEYTETLDGQVYSRPTLYGVFAEEEILPGRCIGEYLGEIVDCETYRRDPVNQYAGLGTPKPHVRSIAPPVNLIVDARGYGNHLRFVRSACHPSAVLRPILRQSGKGASPNLTFGIFASETIPRNEEITLAWDWDDQHIVHSLRTSVMPCMFPDGSVSLPTHNLADPTMRAVQSKYNAVLNHFLGSFSSCACRVKGNCAVAQMINIVRPERAKHANGPRKRSNLGELVGAVRGWRRREIEAEQARKWKIKAETGDFEMASPADSEVDYSVPVEDVIVTPDRSSVKDATLDVKRPLEDLPFLPPSSALTSPPSSRAYNAPIRAVAESVYEGSEHDSEENGDDDDVSMPSADAGEDEEGSQSDATTVTQPKSRFSEDETESEEEDVATPSVEREEAGRLNEPTKAGRRVLSPVAVSNINSDQLFEKLAKRSAGFVRPLTDSVKSQRPVRGAKAKITRTTRTKARKRASVSFSASEDSNDNMPMAKTATVEPAPHPATATSPKTAKLEPRAVVPDQIAAPFGEPVEIAPAPPAAAAVEFALSEEAKLKIEPTPPREPTPPPKEPTPPPPRPVTPPPKKVVSMSDYLKSFRIKKETLSTAPDTPVEEIASPQVKTSQEPAPLTAVEVAAKPPEATAPAPAPALPAPAPVPLPPITNQLEETVKAEYDSAGNRFNLNSFLPTGPRPVGALTPATATPTPTFQPRGEYFPTGAGLYQASPSPAFQPRNASTSFTPRTTMHTPTEESARAMGSLAPHLGTPSPEGAGRSGFVRPPPVQSSFTPRSQEPNFTPRSEQHSFTPRPEQPPGLEFGPRPDQPNFTPRPNGFIATPPKPTLPLPSEHMPSTLPAASMPSALPVRDAPSHLSQPGALVSAPTGPSAERKVPPTGPRAQVAPPTGPKGVRGLPPPSPVPRGPIDPPRGGFGIPPRGFGRGGGGLGRGGYGDREGDRDAASFGGRGLWRGRGGFPPRGRGRGG